MTRLREPNFEVRICRRPWLMMASRPYASKTTILKKAMIRLNPGKLFPAREGFEDLPPCPMGIVSCSPGCGGEPTRAHGTDGGVLGEAMGD